ncbi:MAG: 30S ribosomal protein S20 [Candidatus Omnitrophica bacterium]|nr:30S ribosomal protein S20 [Candidatus Omnitrophota bacterium]
MPNIKSAEKRMRSDAKKRHFNQSHISELKTMSKKLAEFGKENAKEAKELAQALLVKYDKAVKMGVIPRGRADRRKSRISVFVNKLGQTKA